MSQLQLALKAQHGIHTHKLFHVQSLQPQSLPCGLWNKRLQQTKSE